MTLPSQAVEHARDFNTGEVTEIVTPLVWAPETVNEDAIRDAALNALAANRAFLADGNVTNAEAVAQVRALTQQMNKLIRFVLRDFDGTD